MKTEYINHKLNGREYSALRRHSDKVKGIAYDVESVGIYRYMNVYHKPSGKYLLFLTNRPIKNIREVIKMCESRLSEYDWSNPEYSEADLQARWNTICELKSDIYNTYAA